MKKSLNYLFVGLGVLAAWSCQEPVPIDSKGDVPVLQSTSLSDGATSVSVDLGSVTFTYDIPVTLGDSSLISLDGIQVSASAQNLRFVVSFGTLEQGTEYTLTLGEGAVVAKNGGESAEAVSISFTTEGGSSATEEPSTDDSQQDDENTYTPGTPGDYSASLAMANPIPAATKLYEYLLSIYGEYTLSGAMAKVNWNTTECEWIHSWTGYYPAVAYFDYIHLSWSPANWIDYGDITPVQDWWNAGGLVGASWHWLVPKYEGSSDLVYDTTTSFSAANVPVEGTWENEVAKADLDKVAAYLLLLQDAGIPVIWRPLHEASGNTYTQWHSGAWFWWGDDGGAAYKALWQYMFNYFSDKGLRNLIWVWTTQTTTEQYSDYAYYPGDEYVDIVGKDIYNEEDASVIASEFTTVTQMVTNKMVALSELGGDATMTEQWNAGAKWLFYMPWYDNDNDLSQGYAHIYADIAWWKSSFNCSAVLDRSELPSSLFE